MLQRQMQDQYQRKLYKNVIMSEYERRVNASDIKAYETMEPVIHSKVVGVKSPEEAARLSPTQTWKKSRGNSNEMSIDSLKSAAGLMSGQQPVYGAPTAPPAINYALELAKKLNGDGFYNHVTSKPKPDFVNMSPSKVPSKLAEIAAKNMDDPNMQIMRSNTSNLAYGYRPNAVQYQPPMKERPTEAAEKMTASRGNYSMEVQTGETAAMQRPASKRNNGAGTAKAANKSFVEPPRESLLAEAGKEFVKKEHEADKLSFLNPYKGEVDRRGSSLESAADTRAQRRSIIGKYDVKDRDAVKMRPAGASRRQVVNYNIITGK